MVFLDCPVFICLTLVPYLPLRGLRVPNAASGRVILQFGGGGGGSLLRQTNRMWASESWAGVRRH